MSFVISEAQQVAMEKDLSSMGLSEISMMESLAAQMWEKIQKETEVFKAHRVIFLVGPGNNGADALSIFRRALDSKMTPVEWICVAMDPKSDLNKLQRSCLSRYHPEAKILSLKEAASLKMSYPKERVLWIDAFYGLNCKFIEPQGDYAIFLENFRRYLGSCVNCGISLDVVSGLSPDGRRPKSLSFLRAHKSFCVIGPKLCQLIGEGPAASGKLIPFWIGARADAVLQEKLPSFIHARDFVRSFADSEFFKFLREEPDDLHKKLRGQLCVLGGSLNTGAAPVLAAKAALKAGMGYATVFEPSPDAKISVEDHLGEWLLRDLEPEAFRETLKTCDSLVWGCGVPSGGWASEEQARLEPFFGDMLEVKKPLVVDGGGLVSAVRFLKKSMLQRETALYFTPHPREALDILSSLGIEGGDKLDRLALLKLLRESLNSLGLSKGAILLKGAYPMIAALDSDEIFVVDLLSAKLATAGSGDVFSGLIAAIAAQLTGREPSYLPLLLAQIVQARAEPHMERGILASEMPYYFAQAWNEMRSLR